MCNIKKALSRALGIADSPTAAVDTGALNALTAAQTAANAALLAQKQANDQAQAASDSASETDQLAKEARLRKLITAGPFGAALKTNYGDAPVATRELYGNA